MTDRNLYDAIDAARRLVNSGNPWRNAVQYVTETYRVDGLSVAYYLGQYVAGTREASCVTPKVGRPPERLAETRDTRRAGLNP